MPAQKQLYRIFFRHYQSIFAEGLDEAEVKFVKSVLATMIQDGQSEDELDKWKRIEGRVRPKVVNYIMVA